MVSNLCQFMVCSTSLPEEKDTGACICIGKAEMEEATMFALHRSTIPLGQARRQQRSPSLLLLALFTLGSLLVLSTSCSSPAPSASALPAHVTQAQSIREMPVHLALAPPSPRRCGPRRDISIPLHHPMLA